MLESIVGNASSKLPTLVGSADGVESLLRDIQSRLAKIEESLSPVTKKKNRRDSTGFLCQKIHDAVLSEGGTMTVTSLGKKLRRGRVDSGAMHAAIQSMQNDRVLDVVVEKTLGRPITKIRLTNPG